MFVVLLVRGRGLLNAVVISRDSKINPKHRTAWQLCLLLRDMGVLAKPTHENIIRFAPPLCITDEELSTGIKTLEAAIEQLMTMSDKTSCRVRKRDSLNEMLFFGTHI